MVPALHEGDWFCLRASETVVPTLHESDWFCLRASITVVPTLHEGDWFCLTVNVNVEATLRECDWFWLTVSVTVGTGLHECHWFCLTVSVKVVPALHECDCLALSIKMIPTQLHRECNNGSYWSCETERAATRREVMRPFRWHESDYHRVALVRLIVSYFACNRRCVSVTMSAVSVRVTLSFRESSNDCLWFKYPLAMAALSA
jgi:hypothetical protein